jgi:transforming growth factor-beta-induced protein
MAAWTSILTGRFARFSVALVALAMLGACDGDTTTPTDGGMPPTDAGPTDAGPMEMTIAEIAAGNPDFSILVAAATRAELVSVLAAPGTYTVFAPTNAAFEASGLDMAYVEAADPAFLTAVLTYHALNVEVPSSAVTAGAVNTISTFPIFLGTTGGVTINGGNEVTGGANVTATDIEASNGVIHVIDRVLLPPTVADLARYGGLTTLAGAVESAGLTATLQGAGPFTVFAPTNDAFAALPAIPTGEDLANVLLYHVVSGAAVASDAVPAMASSASANAYGQNLTLLFDTSSGVTVNGAADVVIADLRATNGIVHVVDTVILPMNAVDAATAAGLTGLLTAVGAAADLPGGTSVAAALSAQAPYTIFAPTNDAFAPVLAAEPPEETVRDVLLFHVLDPETFTTPVLSTALPAGTTELATLNGATATLDTSGAAPTIEGANIVATDIVVTNGVVHLIDQVIMPPSP